MLTKELKNLSTKEKIVLVQELWDSIEDDTFDTLTPARKKLLAQREKAAKDKNAEFLSWEEVKSRIVRKKK